MLNRLRRIPAQIPSVLLLGAVSQIGQVLFLRELLMVFYGSELSIGIILAAWMVWVGVGSRLGVMFINRVKDPRRVLVFTSLSIAIFIPVILFIMRTSRGFFNVLPGAFLSLWDMTRVSFLLLAPVCTLLGVQFVLLARTWREYDQRNDTTSAAKTYLTEALGNLLGGLTFTFLMVRNLSAFQTALVMAILISVAMYAIIRSLSQPKKVFLWLYLGLFFLSVLSFPFARRFDQWASMQQWAQFSEQHRFVETHPSKHGTITILQRGEQFSFFQSGHLLFSTAGPEAADAGLENLDAVQYAHFAMLQHKNPAQVLIIGGGLRGVLDEILMYPVERVDYIELDEVLTTVARPFLPSATRSALNDPRVQLIHTDGRRFVRTSLESYDLVVLDLPDPATAVLNRFYTIEFFEEVKSLLKDDGVMLLGVSTTPDLRGLAISNRNTTLYHSLSSVFSQRAATSDQDLILIASESTDSISLDPNILTARYLERGITSSSFTPDQFQTLLQETRTRRTTWLLNTHGRAADAHRTGPGAIPLSVPDLAEQNRLEAGLPPANARFFINTDLKPIGYFYTVMFLEHLTRAGQTQALAGLLNVQLWWIIGLLVLPVLITLSLKMLKRVGRPEKSTRFAILISVFYAGFSIMVVQISLIFAFQSVFGYVFEVIGVITALFMCGLVLGTLIARRQTPKVLSFDWLILIQGLMAAFAVLTAIGLPGIVSLRTSTFTLVLFAVLLLVAGFINGLNYPTAAASLQQINQQADQSGGFVYSSELVGACVGAVLASVLVAPIWGMITCCILAACANGTALITLFMNRRTG